MTKSYLKTKNWTPETVGDFLRALGSENANYSNEYKCTFIKEAVKELLKRGGNQNISSAENLLIYATQHYFADVQAQTKADIYYILGTLYELHKENFVRAHTYYEKYALNNKTNGGTHSVLLRALILRDDFSYSEELEKELRMSLGEADLGLRNDRIYENLGRYILNKKEGNEEQCQKIIKTLYGIIKTDELILPDLVFIKDSIHDSVHVPQKVTSFIMNQFDTTFKAN